jgi:glycosyltransferase involved in cell wall biosynthesis
MAGTTEQVAICAPSDPESAMKYPLVSIVVPFFNEETVLPQLLGRLVAVTAILSHRYMFEFVFVDDGSRDHGLAAAKSLGVSEPRLIVVELRRNYGQTAALQAGIDHASGTIIVTMDADLQHFPEDLPLLLARIEQGYDVVCGWRHERQEGVLRRWPSAVANVLIRRISRLTIHDIGTTYRAYRREILEDLRLLGEHHRFIPVFASVAGARIEEVAIQNIDRPVGKSNYNLSRSINVFIDLFFLYFFVRYLDRPIRIFGKIALLTFALGAAIATTLMAIWVIDGTPVVHAHSGWFIVAALFLLASIQLLLAGIIGEMIARVYFSSRHQTLYKVRTIWSGRTGNIVSPLVKG